MINLLFKDLFNSTFKLYEFNDIITIPSEVRQFKLILLLLIGEASNIILKWHYFLIDYQNLIKNFSSQIRYTFDSCWKLVLSLLEIIIDLIY